MTYVLQIYYILLIFNCVITSYHQVSEGMDFSDENARAVVSFIIYLRY